MLTDRSPASVADPFWPLVHGEDRVPLPALPDLLELLLARGREPLVTVVERSPRSFESVGALTAFLRRQLFIAEGGEKDVHFRAILPDHIARRGRRAGRCPTRRRGRSASSPGGSDRSTPASPRSLVRPTDGRVLRRDLTSRDTVRV